MEKRTIFALVLIIVIFYISNEFIWKPKQQAIQQQTIEQPERAPISPEPFRQTETDIEPVLKPFSGFGEDQSIAIDNDITIENETIKVTFSNLGGSIVQVELKEFLDANKDSNVNLIRANSKGLKTSLYDVEGTPINTDEILFSYQTFANSVEFTMQNQDVFIQKTYRLTDSYQLDYSFKVDNFTTLTNYRLGFSNGIADTEEFLKQKKTDYSIYSQIDNQVASRTLAKLKESLDIEGKIDWVAVRSKYFLLALIPDDLVSAEKATLFSVGEQETPAFWVNVNTPQPSFEHRFQIYLGPLVEHELEKFGNGLDKTIQMGPGFLRWLSKLFQAFFIFLYGFIPQWGVCIIIFSFVMKIILYPLTHKSFESSIKMQKVQPKLKEVQAKYKHDPRLMNKEVQKLYKEHGVSPLGGCLPLLLQMPVFFALMPIFRNSIVLRQAEFLWLTDLSEPDPYVILPIIMGVFMFIQQLMMQPKNQNLDDMDEKQKAALQSQKMMGYIMPVVMFFLFKSFPAGLVIYWTTFNIFSLVQQYFIRKKFGTPHQVSSEKK